ncbi:MAG: HAMP domain-containing protein [Candidatus Latescibacteria bacterium]|nr:HAMP domain-containing protein [Candidatus Latescibacterota bacterium]
MKGHIQNRLIAAFLSVAALPLAGVGLYSIHSSTEALRELALTSAKERTRLKARKVEEMLRDIRGDLLLLARSPMLLSLLDELGRDPALVDFWRQKLGQQFMAFAQNKPVYTSLYYIDESGREVVRAEQDGLRAWMVPDERLTSRATRDDFRAAAVLPAGEVHVSSPDRSDPELREPVVRYALRVADRRGQRRGVLVADVFARQIFEPPSSGAAWTSLLNGDGHPLSPAGRRPPAEVETSLAAVRERLLAGESEVVQEQEETTVSWAPVWPGMPGAPPLWLLLDVAPKAEIFASVRRFQVVFVGLVTLTVGAALLLSLLLTRRIAGPLAVLRDGARRIAGGDFDHRLDIRTGDEVQELAEEFNRTGRALSETYRQLHERDAARSEQLRQVSQQLIESEKLAAVGRLAAGVAHEINNPIGVVLMFTQRLLERGDLREADQEKLHIIERHADRIGRITRGLLDFARPREYRQGPVDLRRALEATLNAFAPRLSEAGIGVEWRMTGEQAEILGDEEQLGQVFANLTLNAIQAVEGGGKLIVSVERAASEVLVSFADTGPGIPEEHLNRVFEPFFTTKEVGQGTGLGLAVSYGIVQAHGGRMAAGNRPEGGAVFTVALPVRGEGK